MEYKPDFFIIPYALYEDENIQASDRDIFAVIYYFTKMRGKRCIASNVKISEIAKVNQRSVTNSLMRLESGGYIVRKYEDSGKRIRKEICVTISMQRDTLPSDTHTLTSGTHTLHSGTHTLTSDDVPLTSVQIRKTISKKNKEKNKEGSKIKNLATSPSEFDFRMVDLLSQRISENNPLYSSGQKQLKVNRTSWGNEFRLMRQRDNLTEEQIQFMLEWTQRDEFWKNNILSAKTLRAKFDRLVMDARADNQNPQAVSLKGI